MQEKEELEGFVLFVDIGMKIAVFVVVVCVIGGASLIWYFSH